ncbi:MAG: dipeptide epimerase [Pseudomonadales bacterium]
MLFRTTEKNWPLKTAFVTSQDNLSEIDTVHVEVGIEACTGWGEALGVDYHGETSSSILSELENIRSLVESSTDPAVLRTQLLTEFKPGGARNALDCALWDLQAKQSGARVWQLLGATVQPLQTVITLNLDAPEAMDRQARSAIGFKSLKLKVDADDPIACIAAVHKARPDCEIIIDANSAWSLDQLREWAPALQKLNVTLIEQPLAVGQDDALGDFQCEIPLCADESIQDIGQLEYVAERYQVINIKLDKTGGLTAALQLLEASQKLNLSIMVGNMLGSSLAMAPAFIIGQYCRWVDLDGPLLQAEDTDPAIMYEGSTMHAPTAKLWG